MMIKKGNEKRTTQREMYLIEVNNFETLAPYAAAEIGRMFLLWDAVLTL
jgi:hypothetical protein